MKTSDMTDDAALPATGADPYGHAGGDALTGLFRHALAALNAPVAPVAPGVASEVATLVPTLATDAAEWAESPASPAWRELANALEEHGIAQRGPAACDLAHAVGLASMSASEAGLFPERSARLASALFEAKVRAARAGAPVSDVADVERLAIGWMALAAGVAPVSLGHLQSGHRRAYELGIEFTEAVDLDAETETARRYGADPAATGSEATVIEGIVVCPDVRETSQAVTEVVRAHSHAVAKSLPLVATPDLSGVRRALVEEYPYAVAAVDGLLSPLAGRRHVRLPPTILLGPAGAGKSRLARRLSELLGTGLWRTDAGRADAGSFAGTDRRWSTAECCHPFLAVSRHRIANPMVLVDELDKAGTGRRNGRMWDAMLGFLESETSAAYPDPQLQVDLDLSHVSYVMTCNDIGSLPAPLLDRCRVVEVPCPSPRHLGALLPSILRGIAHGDGLDERWMQPVTPEERALLVRHWRGGSVRHLARLVAAVLRGRAERTPDRWH